LRRFASSAFMPPYCCRQRWNVGSLIPRAWQTSPIVRPAASIPSASRSLTMICSGRCRVRFIESPPGLLGPQTLIAPGPVFGEQTITTNHYSLRLLKLQRLFDLLHQLRVLLAALGDEAGRFRLGAGNGIADDCPPDERGVVAFLAVLGKHVVR